VGQGVPVEGHVARHEVPVGQGRACGGAEYGDPQWQVCADDECHNDVKGECRCDARVEVVSAVHISHGPRFARAMSVYVPQAYLYHVYG